MFTLLAGIAVLVVTGVIFWSLLPRDGKVHRFVGTELEAYIGVALTSAVALALTMTLSAIIDLLGNP